MDTKYLRPATGVVLLLESVLTLRIGVSVWILVDGLGPDFANDHSAAERTLLALPYLLASVALLWGSISIFLNPTNVLRRTAVVISALANLVLAATFLYQLLTTGRLDSLINMLVTLLVSGLCIVLFMKSKDQRENDRLGKP